MIMRKFQLGGKRPAGARLRHAQNYYVLAVPHIEANDWEAARPLLQKALASAPQHFQALRALTNLEFAAGNLRQARVYLNRLLEAHDPRDAETLFLRGNIELSEGMLLQALKSYQRAEAIEGSTPELEFNKGLVHLMLGHGVDAAAIFTRLTQLQPENARTWDALGCALRMTKDFSGATHAFTQALQCDPALNDARDHLAQMLLEMGNPREALTVLEAALAVDDDRASSHHLRGLAYAALHDYPHAINCWETRIARGGAMAETFHLLANAYLQTNNRARAMQVLQTMVAQYPAHLAGHLQLALLLLENGEFEQGWHHLEHARALDPKHPTVIQLVNAANAMRDTRDR